MNNGSVSTSGSNARAASILGGSGTITNNGSLSTTGAAGQTVYMQGNNDHLINTGTITASGAVAGGVSPDAVFSNTAGSSFTALIENRAGGKIISQNGSGIRTLNGNTTIINAGLVQSGVGTAITMGNGNDSLILQTGSVINGTADGGAGSNTVTLQGSGTASNAFTNFQTLLMQGDLWNWTGSGTFTLAHVQTGTLNLSGTLSVSASAIVDGGATLQANAQNLPQSVTDNGLVRLAQDNASTYAGLISGTGAVEKTGAGVLTLEPAAAGGNTYSGGTTITQGTVAIAADNALGAASGGLTFNGGALQLNQALNLAGTRAMSITASGGTIDTQAFSTAISQGITGAGALTKAGTGTLVTTGTNTYAGGTTIANGTLQLGSGGASGSLVGNVANNGSLVFNRSDAVVFPGTISGSGSVTQAGAGTTVLTSNNTYTGGTTLSAGTLQLGNGGTSGSIVGNITNNSALVFNRSDVATYGGAISGSGSVTQTGSGTTALTGNSTYTGGTSITAGTLQLGDGGTSGSIVGDVANNGALVFDRSDLVDFPGVISGTGSVTQAGSGTTVLTGSSTYTGGTSFTAGTLQLGDGGTSGSIVGNVANNGLLVFNRSDNVTFPGIVSGSGSLTQAGAGTTLLTANNPYTGATTVAAGTLAIGDAQHANAALSGGGAVGVASGATLGGYGSVTGNVTNDGTIAVADALPAFASSGSGTFTINGTLTNAGLAAVGGAGVGNRLNVAGSYVGKNSTIALNTVVAGDNAASDKLVISGSTSTATGTSALKITNVGGLGAATLANGIQVIEANNGATTDLSAFRLASPVEVGAYSYYLAKGGVSNGTAQNWYLRNTVPVAATPNPAPPSTPVPPTTPTPPTTPSPPPTQSLPVNPSLPPSADNPIVPADMPIAAPGTQPEVITALAQAANAPSASLSASAPAPAPVYRPEAPVYAAIPMVARQINIQQIDTFHDRQGEQSLLDESGTLPAAWGRVWGGHTVQSQDGALNPEFDGSIYGAQAGHDVYADSTPGGHRNHYGFFVGFTRVTGDVNGYALATPNLDVGHLAINGYSLGAYWTHVGRGGWYTDAVLMGTSLTIDPLSNNGVGATTHGRAVSGSVEAGLPIPLAHGLSIEPQAQLIWQNLSINDLNDGVSTVSFKHGNTFLGRLGVRLEGTYTNSVATWQPYLRLSVLRNFGARDDVTFGGATTLPGSVGQTAGQIGAGLVAKVGKSSSAYATLSYLSNLGGSHQRTITGNAGVRWSW